VGVRLVRRIADYGRMIRFSHSVFALPFALTAAALAAQGRGITSGQVLWIVVAMVAARSAAMGFNRLADRALDAQNARTARRELPRGILGPREVAVFVVLSAVGFVLAAAMLNPLCLALSPLALAIVLGYSYTRGSRPPPTSSSAWPWRWRRWGPGSRSAAASGFRQ
jgi:4-hydroxybenzoate polyprenyltransferase